MINQTYNEEKTQKLEWLLRIKYYARVTTQCEVDLRYGRDIHLEVWLEFKAQERVCGNILEGEGATLERDCVTKIIARQHRGYYGSTR